MTTYVVSRHPGAVEWIRSRCRNDSVVVLAHVQQLALSPADRVIGVLPLRWAEEACRQGAQVWSLDLDLAPDQRDRELSAEEVAAAGARLVAYRVERVAAGD